jgi:hypothetical protein
MDDLFPKDSRAVLLQRSACVCSLLAGDVPFCRSLGLRADLDAAVPTEAQILLGDAAYQVEQSVPGARVTSGRVSVTADGHAAVRLAVVEA